METTDSLFFAPQRPLIDVPRNKKRRGIWLLSVVGHLVFFALLAGMEKERPIPAPAISPPISATLIFPPPAATKAPAAIPELAVEPQRQPADTRVEETIKPAQETASAPVMIAAPSETAKNGSRNAAALTSRRSLDAFFDQQRLAAQQREAEMAASEHRRLKISPDIVDPRKGEPEKILSTPPPVDVNCSDTTTNVLATIASYTGGRLTCTDRSKGFDKFIDARVNKHGEHDN